MPALSHPSAGSVHRDAEFKELDAKGLELTDAEFDACVFKDCSFAGATLRRVRLTDCRFEGCDLTAAKLTGTRLRGAAFKDCRAGGANWAAATALDDLTFTHCLLDHGAFAGAKLPRLRLDDCRLREADFSESDLRSAVIAACDLKGARFFGADLSGADLRGSYSYEIDAFRTKIKKARFSLPEAVSLLQGLDIVLEDQ